MARYRFHIEGYVEIETLRTPAEIRNALVVTAPNLRDSIKQVYRDMLARDLTGESTVEEWVLHTDGVQPMDGGPDIDLDSGDTEETEP